MRSFLAVACARLGLLVFFTSRCVPHVVQAMMPYIVADMGQRDSYAARRPHAVWLHACCVQ